MKWLVRSFILVVVGLCVATALLIRPLSEQLSGWSLLPSFAMAHEKASKSAESGKATASKVAAMHARNAAELENTVTQINAEFRVSATAAQFSSYHVARDYLHRLRLAEHARALGIDVDPYAFGDDAAMRRHIEAMSQGMDPLAAAALTRILAKDGSTTGGPPVPKYRDCVFIYGQRYCRNEDGHYVRADGTVLETSLLGPAQRGREVPASSEPSDPSLPAGDSPYDLDALLDMLEQAQGEKR